jgi:hypothetical protein
MRKSRFSEDQIVSLPEPSTSQNAREVRCPGLRRQARHPLSPLRDPVNHLGPETAGGKQRISVLGTSFGGRHPYDAVGGFCPTSEK